MIGERALLEGTESLQSSLVTLWLWLPLLLVCQWFPYTVAVLVVMHVTRLVIARSAKFGRGRKLLTWVALGSPLVVYAVLLGWYTFSGSQARHLWYRPIGVALLPLLISGALLLPFLLYLDAMRGRRRSLSPALLVAGTAASLALNRFVLPDEYEPLHVMLALFALLCASSFGALCPRWWNPTRRTRWAAVWLGLALAATFAGTLVVSRSHVLSFLVYGKAVGTRYLAARLDWDTGNAPVTATSPRLKPDLSANSAAAAKARASRAAAQAPHIIVFSIDNVQADHVGSQGYTRHPTTPNIDALAREGMLFERAYSWFPRTRMFLTSMLLGRAVPRFTEHEFARKFRDKSLTRLLQKRGYHVLLKGWFDEARHFEPDGYGVHTWMPPSAEDARQRLRRQPHVPMARNYRTIERHFKRARRRNAPVFAWMHFLRPHPYKGRFYGDPKRGFGSRAVDIYDSAVAVADAYLAELRALARKHLESDRPVYWFVMSDHGTGFSSVGGEVRLQEGRNVAESFVRVPLIVAGPGVQRGRTQSLVSASIDTAATILDLVGVEPPASYDGVSLMPVLAGDSSPSAEASRAVYLNYYGWHGMVHGVHKLVMYKGGVSLVNLHDDPLERRNIADQEPELVRQLKALTVGETSRIQRAFAEQ